MLLITCPWCGPRDEIEFRWGGESHIRRPTLQPSPQDEEWADYLFYRKNPKGLHRERWVHEAGCGQWFNIARDTVSHEIVEVYRMGEAHGQAERGKRP